MALGRPDRTDTDRRFGRGVYIYDSRASFIEEKFSRCESRRVGSFSACAHRTEAHGDVETIPKLIYMFDSRRRLSGRRQRKKKTFRQTLPLFVSHAGTIKPWV